MNEVKAGLGCGCPGHCVIHRDDGPIGGGWNAEPDLEARRNATLLPLSREILEFLDGGVDGSKPEYVTGLLERCATALTQQALREYEPCGHQWSKTPHYDGIEHADSPCVLEKGHKDGHIDRHGEHWDVR